MIDWQAVWNVVMPAVVALGTWIATRKPSQAKVDAAVAQSRAATAASDADGSVYIRLRQEMDAMRGDIAAVRAELQMTRKDLDAERAHSRRQDTYIWVLIRMLRELGKEPPPFDDVNPPPVPA
jgi:hypothetical protein